MSERGRPERRRPIVLRLYVAGESPNSIVAQTNLRRMIATLPPDQVRVEIVDVLRDPQRGLRDRVFVTPTLVRVEPAPERRVIGNLKDRDVVRSGIGCDEVSGD